MMDADKLLRRVDLKREHLNTLRLDPEHRKGWGEALEFFTNTEGGSARRRRATGGY
jgi:hypothetical protein